MCEKSLSTANEALTQRIRESIRSGRISHAYLIEGPSHVDKPAFARGFIKGILCPQRRGDDCGECPICSKIDHENHEDLIYVGRVKNKSTIQVKQIREMQDRIAVKPNGPRYVVTIDESETMTEEAQNCLLKTLEEPPGGTVLLLLTDNSRMLLPTIRSRCVLYRIEGADKAADETVWETARQLIDELLNGSPFYRLKKILGEQRMDRTQTLELIDCMEERCRQIILSRNENGVPRSPEEIRRCVEALEKARQQVERGQTSGYVLKRLLLTIGG